jgi:signal transduction histidine kinase
MADWLGAYIFLWVIQFGSSIPFYLQIQDNTSHQSIPIVYTMPIYLFISICLFMVMAIVWVITANWQYRLHRHTKSELQNTKQALETAVKKHETLQQNIIDISEREQLRIGHELHDGVVHDLTALGLAGDILQKEISKESPELSIKLKEFISIVDQSANKLRNIAKGLSPVNLDELGLCAAIEQMAKKSVEVSGMGLHCQYNQPLNIKNHEKALQAYRIVQEAVNNAVKHSQAKNIKIQMDEQNGEFRFMVQDDGKGFDASKNGHNGMGIYIMKYRADLTGANFNIESNANDGTSIRFTFQEGHSNL